MNSLYTIAGVAPLALSSAVVLPILLLIGVVTAVAGLVVAIDRRHVRKRAPIRFKSSGNGKGNRSYIRTAGRVSADWS
jgi:hypothetical protein